MKRLVLLFCVSCTATASFAQHMRFRAINAQADNTRVPYVEPQAPQHSSQRPQAKNAAKTTSTVFWGPETFGSGTSSTLPTGWTANSMPSPGGGTWKWANTASTSPYTMGAMHSTTASDGWMIFDSDLLGIGGGTPSGYLQSPAITACATQSSVRLNFENYFRNFYDSCSIWVSTSPSFAPGTYAVHPVYYNNSTAVNVSTPNPSIVHVNLTSTAAMQPTVYIRFVYYGYAGGSYSWMIDDITLSTMDAVDVGVSKSAALYYSGTAAGWAAFGSKPAKMMDTVYPLSFAANYGTTPYTAATVNAKIFQGTTSVYDKNTSVLLPVDALDSVADFSTVGTPPGYFSTTQASYTMPFSVNMTGDADPSNDRDTAMYRVSDTAWTENSPNAKLAGAQFIYQTSPLRSFSPATGFVESAGHVDTVTSISVAFADTTVSGQVVGLQLFQFNGTDWVDVGATEFRPLADADISTASSIVYANFKIDYSASAGYMILDGGSTGTTYAAVLKGKANTAEVAVLTSEAPGPEKYIGYSAYSDTSNNDGSATDQFGQTGLPYANSTVPLIALNFGTVPPISIADINASKDIVGKAYPNPANTTLSIPFTLARDGQVTVSLTNVVGQVVASQTITAIAGQSSKATFATGNLPSGMYIYTTSTNGRSVTGKVTITH